jgi:hypothetical protein
MGASSGTERPTVAEGRPVPEVSPSLLPVSCMAPRASVGNSVVARQRYCLSMLEEPLFAVGCGVTLPSLSTFTASRFVALFSAPPVFL